MSNSKKYKNYTVSSSQQGAVLIVVLLFLVLIISAGVIAVRESTTDLRLSTSDQINTLLLQSADNSNQNIEQTTNSVCRVNKTVGLLKTVLATYIWVSISG